MRRGIGATAVAVLLISASGRAQAPDDASRYLEVALQLWDRLEYERALTQLERAKKVSRGVKDDAAIALLEGLVKAEMNLWDQAESAFREALYLVPDATLPTKVSPKVRSRVEEIRAEVKRVKARSTTPPVAPPIAAPAAIAPPPAVAREDEPASSARLWIPAAIAGGALVAVGGISFALSKADASALKQTPNLEDPELHNLATRGKTLQTAGVTAMIAGAAGLAVAGFLFATADPAVAVAAVPGGAFVLVGVPLP